MATSKEKRTTRLSENAGWCWGLVCLIPFGWIVFLANLIRCKNDVIKRGVLSAKLALIILHNCIISFTVVTALIIIIGFVSWKNGGILYIPNIIAVVVVTIVYNVVVEKILRFGEEKQLNRGKDDLAGSKTKTVKRRSNDSEEESMRKQLKELKEQNKRQASIIGKLEKEIKNRESGT